MMERLRELSEKATKGRWVAFDVNNVLAIMKGPRPPRDADGRTSRRWQEIVAWPGFDSADTPKHKRRADLHFIVASVNYVRDMLTRPSPEGELREALEPFAEAAANIPADQDGFKIVAHVPAGPNARHYDLMSKFLTADNFRRAREILSSKGSGHG